MTPCQTKGVFKWPSKEDKQLVDVKFALMNGFSPDCIGSSGRQWFIHRRLCRVKNMLAMYLKYHKAGLTPTTPVTSIAISPVKMSIGRKSLTTLRSEMIFLQGKPVFYIFLPSTPPY
jgi:hypothetical protein